MSTTAPRTSTDTVFERIIARQPILDGRERLYAYEMLFRRIDPELPFDGEEATDDVLDQCASHALAMVPKTARAFVNLTRDALLDGRYSLLPAQRVVLELLENVPLNNNTLRACRELKAQGYTLALDDVVSIDDIRPALSLADIVKVDFALTTQAQQQEISATLSNHGITRLAEKVETRDEFDRATDMGYELFQGYFFQKPELIASTEVPMSQLVYLEFLDHVTRPEVDFDQLEQITKRDLSLSVKLLKYLNSARFDLAEKVTSIKQALVLLGERPLRQWAAIAGVSCLSKGRPAQLVIDSLVRARFAESLAGQGQVPETGHELFLMGLLSMLDTLTRRPLDELLMNMSVSYEVRTAMMGARTPTGRVYSLILSLERADQASFAAFCEALGLDPAVAAQRYQDALIWADEVFAEVQ